MKRLLTSILLVASLLPAADFYVSPNGSDMAAGTQTAPFAGIARAQRAVRELRRRAPQRKTPVVVEIKGGLYPLSATLLFRPEDSGRAESRTIYRACPGETPVFSGGVRLTGWTEKKNRWEMTLPEVKAGNWRFSQLFVNGQRRYRPRLPKGEKSYYYIQRQLQNVGEGRRKGNNQFRFAKGEIRADWHNLSDVEVLVFHNWSMSRLPIQAVNTERRAVTLAGFTWHKGLASLSTGRNYLVENVREALTEPGEWYLDRQSGLLAYLPMPGEVSKNCEVVAPRLDYLVGFEGDAQERKLVEYISLEGLVFEHTNWNAPKNGHCVPQSDVSGLGTQGKSLFPVALRARWAKQIRISSCTVRHVGFYGAEFGEGTRNCELIDAELWDLGAGGVMLGTTRKAGLDDPRLAKGHLVENCMIAHGGRMHPAGTGIWVGHAAENRILHNDVFDFYYTAVSVGWSWSYGFSPAKRNLVSHNHLYDIGQERLSDLGGIYTLGASEGTVLSYNRIHDISRVHYGGSGIYFDQGSSGITVENNIVYRTQDATFTVHWAKDDVVRNNIFANGENFQIGIGRVDKSGPVKLENNIVSWINSRATSKRKCREDWIFSKNLYWANGAKVEGFGNDDLDFAGWQKSGRDLDSLVGDPGFKDPKNGDFTLAANSPAFKLGFQAIDATTIGRQTPRRRGADSPLVPHAYPPEGQMPAFPIADDFEESFVGEKPGILRIHENSKDESAYISDLQAYSGSKSLRVVNGNAEGPEYNPHFYYCPGYSEGTVRNSFRLYMETPIDLAHAWRNNSNAGFKTGPNFQIQRGTLVGDGKELLPLPVKTWITFEIVSRLGDENTGTFDLGVTIGEGEKKVFADLPCDRLCRKLGWLGWIASGKKPGVFYIDDMNVVPQK